jgi:heme/copper-type cytochrome/quinol oxidase subunit 4
MPRNHEAENGFTVYQLLVSIVVLVIVGSLWLAYDQNQKTKQKQALSLTEQVRRG